MYTVPFALFSFYKIHLEYFHSYEKREKKAYRFKNVAQTDRIHQHSRYNMYIKIFYFNECSASRLRIDFSAKPSYKERGFLPMLRVFFCIFFYSVLFPSQYYSK